MKIHARTNDPTHDFQVQRSRLQANAKVHVRFIILCVMNHKYTPFRLFINYPSYFLIVYSSLIKIQLLIQYIICCLYMRFDQKLIERILLGRYQKQNSFGINKEVSILTMNFFRYFLMETRNTSFSHFGTFACRIII